MNSTLYPAITPAATALAARLDQARAAAKAGARVRVIALPVLDESSDAARCEDCAHLPGCFCPHVCTPRGI